MSVSLLLLRSWVTLSFKVVRQSYHNVLTTDQISTCINAYRLCNDLVPARINRYHLTLAQYHQVPTIAVLHWPITQLHHLVRTFKSTGSSFQQLCLLQWLCAEVEIHKCMNARITHFCCKRLTFHASFLFFAVIAKGFADFSWEMHLKFEFHLNFSTTSLISGNTIPTLLWMNSTTTEFDF